MDFENIEKSDVSRKRNFRSRTFLRFRIIQVIVIQFKEYAISLICPYLMKKEGCILKFTIKTENLVYM